MYRILTLLISLLSFSSLHADSFDKTTQLGEVFNQSMREILITKGKMKASDKKIPYPYVMIKADALWKSSDWSAEEAALWKTEKKVKLPSDEIVQGLLKLAGNKANIPDYYEEKLREFITTDLKNKMLSPTSTGLQKKAMLQFLSSILLYDYRRKWMDNLEQELAPLAKKMASIKKNFPSVTKTGANTKGGFEHPFSGKRILWTSGSKTQGQYTIEGSTICLISKETVIGEHLVLTSSGELHFCSLADLKKFMGKSTYDNAWIKSLKPNQKSLLRKLTKSKFFERGGRIPSKYEKYLMAERFVKGMIKSKMFNWSKEDEANHKADKPLVENKKELLEWLSQIRAKGKNKYTKFLTIFPPEELTEVDYKLLSDVKVMFERELQNSYNTVCIMNLKDLFITCINIQRKTGSYPGAEALKTNQALLFSHPKTKNKLPCILVSQRLNGKKHSNGDDSPRSVYLAAPAVFLNQRAVLYHDGGVTLIPENEFQKLIK